MGLLQQTTIISSADHYDLSLVCQAQVYQIVGQKKKPLQPVGKGDAGAPAAPFPGKGLKRYK